MGYQRSIRQICRSPYIETTISLPFVGMIGIAADRCHYWYRECRSLICEMVRKYLHLRNRAKRSATIELTLRGQKGLLLPYPSFAARRYYVLFCSLKSFDGWLRCGEISELNSVAHAGDTRLVVRGRWLSTLPSRGRRYWRVQSAPSSLQRWAGIEGRRFPARLSPPAIDLIVEGKEKAVCWPVRCCRFWSLL